MNRRKTCHPVTVRVPRIGLTVIELLVVVGLLSLLVALLLPAVQRSRAAAQRLTCVNQLKQIVLASQHYHDQFGQFPGGSRHMEKLMPFMEQAVDWTSFETAFTPPVFLCPSDPLVRVRHLECSYFYSSGSGRVKFTGSGLEFDGMVYPAVSTIKLISLRDVTDGTSTTAMYGERLNVGDRNAVTDSAALKNRKPHMWYMNRDYKLLTEFEAFQTDCLQNASTHTVPTLSPIFDGVTTIIGYNHTIPPNRPGCYSIAPPRHTGFDYINGAIPATSLHDGGVHTAFADGHVAFVSESIDDKIWMNLGSRNGGESDVGSW